MTIVTTVPTNLRVPQLFHLFSFIPAGNALAPLTVATLLIGTIKGGTGVAGTTYPVEDANVTDGVCGVGTPLALMCRAAIAQQSLMRQGARLYMIPVAENAAGAARVQTFTLTGTATAQGSLVVRIAGRTIPVPINLGDAAAAVATNLNTAINTLFRVLPGSSTVAGAVVTFTASTKGVWGQNIVFTVDQATVPTGLTCATASTVSGTGVQDETAALAASMGTDYDTIALENHDTVSVAVAVSHVNTAWGPSEKKWRQIVYAENGSIGTATPLASTANNIAIVVANMDQSPSLNFEIATAYACAISGQSRPNANWDAQQLVAYPPPDSAAFSTTAKETGLAAGLTPLLPVKQASATLQNVVQIVKAQTTQTTQGGQPFELTRDLAVPRAAAFMARQIDVAFAARFSASTNNPDGALLDDDALPKVRDMIAGVMYAAQDLRVIKNVDADLAKLVLELDPSAIGRINCSITYTVVVGLHQVAFVHRITVGG